MMIDIFNSDYIAAQIRQMNEAIEKYPANAIGKAKEILALCCQTISTYQQGLVSTATHQEYLCRIKAYF
jgi:hypothetical protein